MRRITIEPGAADPVNGRRRRSGLRSETTGYDRLDFTDPNAPGEGLGLDGMSPTRVSLGAEEIEARRSARGQARPERFAVDDAAAWRELARLGMRAQAAAADLDFEDIESEYDEFGDLSEETFARLEAAGIPRYIVENYIEGQEALAAEMRREMIAIVGDEARYEAMLDWARNTLSDAELMAFEQAVGTSTETARLAIEGMYAHFVKATGERPKLGGAAGPRAGRGGSSFASTEELVTAIRDPRYKKDAAYRADVEARLARSNLFKR